MMLMEQTERRGWKRVELRWRASSCKDPNDRLRGHGQVENRWGRTGPTRVLELPMDWNGASVTGWREVSWMIGAHPDAASPA